MIKDPDEEIHRERFQEGPRYRSFCLRGVGLCHPPSTWMRSKAWKLSELLGYFYGGFIFWHDRSLTPLLALLPLKRMGSRAENSKLFVMACSNDQQSSRNHPEVHPELPHQNRRHAYHPGNYEGFRSSVSGTRVKVQIVSQKIFLVFLSHRKFQDFQEFCAGNRDGDQIYSIFIIINHNISSIYPDWELS